METVVGIVGPVDLVADVAPICEEMRGIRVERYPYSHESEAPSLVEKNAAGIDAWLFTGIIPYTLARGALTRPAAYIDYTGPTLLQAFVHFLREGHDITRLSVDTLATADVNAVLTEAAIPTDGVSTLPFRPGVTSETLVNFHRKRAEQGSVAITCVSSVYEELKDELTILRLVPSWHSIRTTIQQLVLVTTNQIHEDSQVALGIVEAFPPSGTLDDDIAAEATSLGGTSARFADGRSLIVTTRGQLSAATDQLTSAPILHRLAAGRSEMRIGFGLGHSAAEAESLARRALSRARNYGPVAAVASFRNDIDIVLDAEGRSTTPAVALDQASIGVVAARVGLSVPTLQKLHQAAKDASEAGDESFTTRDIAAKLGIQQRTARRIIQRLELAGYADRMGHHSSGSSGRPLTLYRLRL